MRPFSTPTASNASRSNKNCSACSIAKLVAAHPLMARCGAAAARAAFALQRAARAGAGSERLSLLTRSAATGVDAFAREERGASLFVCFQGHPEYEADTLLREYRRDIGRFLRREQEHYPEMPQGYFNDDAAALAEAFRARAICDVRQSSVADFPMSGLEAGVENTWRRSAIGIYA